jgi:hypothetical protein
MKNQTLLLLLAVTVPCLSAIHVVSSNPVGVCDGPGAGGAGIIEVSPADSPTATFYIDDRNVIYGNGIWLYQESNGVFVGGVAHADLQRGGNGLLLGDPETCTDVGPWLPDTLVADS